MYLWQWFDMLDIGMFIFVEDDARVHDVGWIEELLDFAHEFVGIVAPFATNEWRHITTRTVLGLETTMVFIDHQVHDCTHHAIVLLDGLWRVETLVEDEVVVAL